LKEESLLADPNTDKTAHKKTNCNSLIAAFLAAIVSLFGLSVYLYHQQQQIVIDSQRQIASITTDHMKSINDLQHQIQQLSLRLSMTERLSQAMPDHPVEIAQWLMALSQLDYTVNKQQDYIRAGVLLSDLQAQAADSSQPVASRFLTQLNSFQVRLHHMAAYSQTKQAKADDLQQLIAVTDQLVESVSVDFYQMSDWQSHVKPELISLSKSWQENIDSFLNRLTTGYAIDYDAKQDITMKTDLEKSLFVWHVRYQLAMIQWALVNHQAKFYHPAIANLSSQLAAHLSSSKKLILYQDKLKDLDQFVFEPMVLDLTPIIEALYAHKQAVTPGQSGEMNQSPDAS
tara:strand:- start:678 stop:1709 length:1032 start_codon:yes stop_codon:yes gene_type:complete